MDDTTPLAPAEPVSMFTPTSAPRPTAKNSYFPLVPEHLPLQDLAEDIMMSSGDVTAHPTPSPPIVMPRTSGLKRKISDSTSSHRNTSAKRDPEISTPVTSWYSRAKPAKFARSEGVSTSTAIGEEASRIDDETVENNPYDEEGRSKGLPMIDPSDRPVVVMCDDNPDMRLWISSLLQTDYNVIEARNGAAALEILATIVPDLVCILLTYPRMLLTLWIGSE